MCGADAGCLAINYQSLCRGEARLIMSEVASPPPPPSLSLSPFLSLIWRFPCTLGLPYANIYAVCTLVVKIKGLLEFQNIQGLALGVDISNYYSCLQSRLEKNLAIPEVLLGSVSSG